MKDLRDLTEEGLYTFDNPEYGRLRVLKEVEDLFFCMRDVGNMLGLKNPKASLNHVLRKYEENKVDTTGLTQRYPCEDSNGRVQDSLMIREDVFFDSFSSPKSPSVLR